MVDQNSRSPLTTLTSAAVDVFRSTMERPPENIFDALGRFGFLSDPVAAEASRSSFIPPDIAHGGTLSRELFAEPMFQVIAPREGALDPMLIHPGGGIRLS